MSELSFAKQFLSTLDSKPIKLPSDHVSDPKKFEVTMAYTLPKMSQPMKKKQKLAPGQERSINVSLKSLRNPPLDISLPIQPLSTSIHDLKQIVSEKANIATDKVKLLHKKKPCSDSKTLQDLVADGDSEVEISVMVIGGATIATPERSGTPAVPDLVDAPVAQQSSGDKSMETEEFWSDLKGYLTQRLKDQDEGEKVFDIFKAAWDLNKSLNG
ncbi:MAG: hypothetical protein M1836_003060 [Candelina mexicana]|nr:MAG: hypothetical protein M1836_003060 [Candelina mexicana]